MATDVPDGNIHRCDTIEYEGGLWLVPYWIENISEGYKSPVRIIRMDTLQFQRISGFGDSDFLLNDPIPKSVLDGQTHKQGSFSFVVVESPDIRVPIPSRNHH